MSFTLIWGKNQIINWSIVLKIKSFSTTKTFKNKILEFFLKILLLLITVYAHFNYVPSNIIRK